jgi:hypothetical protein
VRVQCLEIASFNKTAAGDIGEKCHAYDLGISLPFDVIVDCVLG